MGLLTDNVIPGNHGKIFTTDATETIDLERIRTAMCEVEGVKDVILNAEAFPVEFTVQTESIVPVEAIENAVKAIGYHAIGPHPFFPL